MTAEPVAASSTDVGRERAAGSPRPIPFCCPLCKGPLQDQPEAYRCSPCAREYPVVLGIPDFRVFQDPYIDYADDHAKVRRLAAREEGRTFAEMLELYWEMTPETPRHLVPRFIRHVLGGADRGRSSLAEIREAGADLLGR